MSFKNLKILLKFEIVFQNKIIKKQYLDKDAPFSQNSDKLEEIFDDLGIPIIDRIAKDITYNDGFEIMKLIFFD